MRRTGSGVRVPVKSNIVVTCGKGIPPFLAEELRSLGFPVLAEGVSDVATEGTVKDTYRLNLTLRTAQRVLFLINEFTARDADDLYRGLSEVPWEEHIPADGYLCVTSSVDTPSIRDTRFANLRAKDAIVDRIRARRGRRPHSGPDREHTVVNLYWKDEHCSVSFDTSGAPLSRRGYRKIPLAAPMQETLAAAVIMATGWDGSGHFINPMCGSGTLAIEAALAGLGRAPGLLRDNFGFMHLRGFDRTYWDDLRARTRREARKALGSRVIATDINPEAVEAARKNATTAGVEHLIEFAVCDYSQTEIPEGGGVIVLNPEYGERMGEKENLAGIYSGIGDFFKQRCGGYTGYIFTGNLDLAKRVGLRARRRVPFFTGDLECRLLEYELYAGSRKTKKAAGE